MAIPPKVILMSWYALIHFVDQMATLDLLGLKKARFVVNVHRVYNRLFEQWANDSYSALEVVISRPTAKIVGKYAK